MAIRTVIYCAVSLDGNIARSDGSLDWLIDQVRSEQDDYGFSLFLESVDAVLMGRKTFEAVQGFSAWPYTKPVFILTNTLHRLPMQYDRLAEIVQGTPEQILRELEGRGIERLYIDGGMTVSSFLRADRIDEMIITTVATVIGEGIKLFNQIERTVEFAAVETQILNNSMVKTRFVRKRS